MTVGVVDAFLGVAHSVLFEMLWVPAPRFTIESIPDLSGKVVIVTGANTGIGKETARVLLTKNAKVWIACRNVAKGEAALRQLKELTGRDAHLLKLDLANLGSIKEAAEEFLRQESQLHILFNNAGVMDPPIDKLTDDGYDLQFGTNVLGHFYFTKLLLPALVSTARSSPGETVRVVNTSSVAHWLSGLHFDTFVDSPKRRNNDTLMLYGQSKFGNIIFSNELHRRYRDQGIVSTAVHPGVVNSELLRYRLNFLRFVGGWFLWDPSHGALTQLYAGTAPEAADLGGQYLVPWARIGKPCSDTEDPQLSKELWQWLEEQVDKL